MEASAGVSPRRRCGFSRSTSATGTPAASAIASTEAATATDASSKSQRRSLARAVEAEGGGIARDYGRGKVLGKEVAGLRRKPVADLQEEDVIAHITPSRGADGAAHTPGARVVGGEGEEPRRKLRIQPLQVVEGTGGGRKGIQALVDEIVHPEAHPPCRPRHELPEASRPHPRLGRRVVARLDYRQVAERSREPTGGQERVDEVLVATHSDERSSEASAGAGVPVAHPPADALLNGEVLRLG